MWPSAQTRCRATLSASETRRLAQTHWNRALEATISRSVLLPVSIRPLDQLTSISALIWLALLARAMLAISRAFSARPLPLEFRFLLTQTINLARRPPQSALRKRLAQWNALVACSMHLNQSHSVIRRRLIRQAHYSLDLWPKKWKR